MTTPELCLGGESNYSANRWRVRAIVCLGDAGAPLSESEVRSAAMIDMQGRWSLLVRVLFVLCVLSILLNVIFITLAAYWS